MWWTHETPLALCSGLHSPSPLHTSLARTKHSNSGERDWIKIAKERPNNASTTKINACWYDFRREHHQCLHHQNQRMLVLWAWKETCYIASGQTYRTITELQWPYTRIERATLTKALAIEEWAPFIDQNKLQVLTLSTQITSTEIKFLCRIVLMRIVLMVHFASEQTALRNNSLSTSAKIIL